MKSKRVVFSEKRELSRWREGKEERRKKENIGRDFVFIGKARWTGQYI